MSAPFMDGVPASRRRYRGFVWLAIACASVALAWTVRIPLLRSAAGMWIVSDAVAPADAAAVLGGGVDVRPFAAAEYYRKGLVKKILVADVRPSRAETLGITPSHTELNRRALIALGVPMHAIEIFGHAASSTHEEVAALHAWAQQSHAGSVIVPTEVFSSRRVRWVLGRMFAGDAVRIVVPALEARDYASAEWWRSEQGLIAFQNEVLKYVYYRIKYRDPLKSRSRP